MTSHILIGKFPDGDNSANGYGVRISKAGYDVNTPNPNNENLVFNSDWPGILPIHLQGALSVGAGGTVSVNHNLGYIPFISAMVNISGRGWEQYACLNYGPRVMSKKRVQYYKQASNSEPNPTTTTPSLTTAAWDFTCRPQSKYAYQEDRSGLDTCQIYADTTKLYFYCSSAASAYYMIYRWRAF